MDEIVELRGIAIRNQMVFEVENRFYIRFITNTGKVLYLELSDKKPKAITDEELRRHQAKLDAIEKERKIQEERARVDAAVKKEIERLESEKSSKLQQFIQKITK